MQQQTQTHRVLLLGLIITLSGFFGHQSHASMQSASDLAIRELANAFVENSAETLGNSPIFESRPFDAGDIERLTANVGADMASDGTFVTAGGHGTGYRLPTATELTAALGASVITGVTIATGEAYHASASVDLSSDPAFPATGNQAQQGSCAAWALGYYAYGYLEAKDQNWTASSGNASQLMSPAWIYNKVNGGVDGGSSFFEVGNLIIDYGCTTLAAMPYDDADLLSWGNETAWRDAPRHRAEELYYIDIQDLNETIQATKALLEQGTPVVFAIDASEYPANYYSDFIISSVDYDSLDLNHAQTIVGYNDSITKDGETGAFRVANSWGSAFGDGGYYWLTYEAFREIFGVDPIIQYPMFLQDKAHYSPQYLATWTFSKLAKRSVGLSVSVGESGSYFATKSLWFDGGTAEDYPDFMAVDVSELGGWYENSSHYFTLEATGNSNGRIDTFSVEAYDAGYGAGLLTRISTPTTSFPVDIPGNVPVLLLAFPEAPLNLVATAGNQTINLTWTAPASLPEAPITAYTVYRTNATHWTAVGTTANITNFVDALVINGEAYRYRVTANNSAGESPPSAIISAFAYTIPAAPQNLTEGIDANQIYISWAPPNQTGGAPITGYDIYRAENWTGEALTNVTGWLLIAQEYEGLVYADTPLYSGNFTYAVAAVNLGGTGNFTVSGAVEFQFDPNLPPLDDTTIDNTTIDDTATDDSATDDTAPGDDRPNLMVLIPAGLGILTLAGVGAVVYYVVSKGRR